MPFFILLFGVLLVVVAYNNSASALTTELETDLKGYFKWAAAIVAILALGYVPGLRTPSRWLLGLVALVVALTQWSNIQSGFTAFTSSPGSASGTGTAQANPTASYTAANAPAAAAASGSQGSGSSSTASATAPVTAASLIAANPLSPSSYVQAAGLFGGFGGTA